MKKIIFYLTVIVFIITACEEQDNIERYNLGTEFFVSDGGITSLDSKVSVNINNQPKNISLVDIYNGADKVTDVKLTDGLGTTDIKAANIGLNNIDDNVVLEFKAVADNGNSIVRYHSIGVEDPISITAPDLTHNYDTTYYFKYRIDTYSANVDNLVLMGKVNSGKYEIIDGDHNLLLDSVSVPLKELGVKVGDTITVKVTAKAGTKIAETETPMVIAPCSFNNVNQFKLDTTANQAYDLIEARMIESTTEFGDSADIVFTAKYPIGGGPVMVGFKSINNAEFIVGTDDDYTIADKIDISTKDFSSSFKSVKDAKVGDIYIYRTNRGSEDYVYGVMKVTLVNKPQGVLEDSSIAIEYKH